MVQVVAFIVFFVFGTTAYAGIYKCQGVNGKTVFSDEPCMDGHGKKFNLGATVESSDPTGNKGDVSGNYGTGDKRIQIQDALGVLTRSKSELFLYLVPVRYTSADVQHFQEVGSDLVLKQKPSLDPAGLNAFPYLNLHIKFKKDQPLTRENIESVEWKMFGLQPSAKPLLVKQTAQEAMETVRYISVFEDIAHGDINLEADNEAEVDGKAVSWNISIRAPLYFH